MAIAMAANWCNSMSIAIVPRVSVRGRPQRHMVFGWLALHSGPAQTDVFDMFVVLTIDYELFDDESKVPCRLKTISVMYQKDEVIKALFLEWLIDMA